jgi:hypothetical protein
MEAQIHTKGGPAGAAMNGRPRGEDDYRHDHGASAPHGLHYRHVGIGGTGRAYMRH